MHPCSLIFFPRFRLVICGFALYSNAYSFMVSKNLSISAIEKESSASAVLCLY